MHYVVQNLTDIDTKILLSVLSRDFSHTFELSDAVPEVVREGAIPVGNLDFVGKFLSQVYGVQHMNPIEIPEILRKPKWLGRAYEIVDKNELPEDGHWFVKYVSSLKYLTYEGSNGIPKDNSVFKDGLYALSDPISILAEYRVFVYHDEIVHIERYDGDASRLPSIDTIHGMVLTYSCDKHRPGAYIMDVGVDILGRTLLIEIQPFVSCGLYSYVWSKALPGMYAEGFMWYVEENILLKKTEVITNEGSYS